MSAPQKLHLLVVEDDVGDFRRLRRDLRERSPERYVVRHASNVVHAVRMLTDEHFAVVLLDISLPDIAVEDEVKTIRGAAPKALILALATNWDSELATQAIGAGAHDYLIKEDLSGGRLAHAIDIALVRHGAGVDDGGEEQLSQAIVDAVSELAIVVDQAGFLKSGHENLERVLGHRPQDLHFRTWMQLLHPDDQAAARSAWHALRFERGGTQRVTGRLPRADGSWREHQLQLTNMLDDPAVEGVIVIGPDISLAAERQAMFDQLTGVLQAVIGATDQDAGVHEALGVIGSAFDAEEARLLRFDLPAGEGVPRARQFAAWTRSGREPALDLAQVERSLATPEVVERLNHAARVDARSGVVQIAPRRFAGDGQGSGEPLILVPVTNRGVLAGVVVLVTPERAIDWPEPRRTMLRSMVNAIGLVTQESPAPEESDGLDRTVRILDTVGTGLVLFDWHGQLLHANQAVTAITGVEPEALLERLQPYIEKGEGPSTDQVFRRSDGSRAFARFELMPLVAPDGTPDGGVITLQDVTNLYRAQRIVQRSQAELRTIVSTVNVGLLTLDDRARLESINPMGEELFGIIAADVVGKTLAAVLPPPTVEVNQPFVHDFLEGIQEADVGSEREMLATCSDGTIVRVAVVVTAYQHQNRRKYIASIREMGLDKSSDDRIAHQLQQLEVLHRIDRVLSSTRDQQLILDVVADQVVMMPDLDIAIIRTFSDVSRHLDLKAARGIPATARVAPYLLLGQGTIGRAAVDRRVLKLPRLQETLVNDGDDYEFFRYQVGDGYALPLVANSQLRGTLEVYRFDAEGISDQTTHFLNRIAAQAALAIEDTNMMAELERSKQLLEGAYEVTLEGWSRALELRGVDTKGHSRRVMDLAVQLGRELGLRERDLLALRRGALLHDIGKIAVPDAVLHKPGELNEEDWAMIREIPHHAMNLLSGNDFLRDAAVVPYFHNEKWDGSGYPNGLVGETIPLTARVFAIVDVWDTLISDRPYRKALARDEAIEQMSTLAGKSFDPALVETFLKMVSDDEGAPEEVADALPPAGLEAANLLDLDEDLDIDIDTHIVS